MNDIELEEIHLIGIALPGKTTNENNQSATDCGNLWQKFEKGNYASLIPGKINDEILAVYHQYEGDQTRPYSYFIGCRVPKGTAAPAGMDRLLIPGGRYKKILSRGKIPNCIMQTWQAIWNSDIDRAYEADFEVYGDKSHDWNKAEVEVFLSIGQ